MAHGNLLADAWATLLITALVGCKEWGKCDDVFRALYFPPAADMMKVRALRVGRFVPRPRPLPYESLKLTPYCSCVHVGTA